MLNAVEAKYYATKNEMNDAYRLRKDCEEKILEACHHNQMWCLVPLRDYKPTTIVYILNELIQVYDYSVGQRSNEEGRCLYIRWGRANVQVNFVVSKNNQTD